MKININQKRLKNIFYSFIILSGFFFVLFNIGFSIDNTQQFSLTNNCYATGGVAKKFDNAVNLAENVSPQILLLKGLGVLMIQIFGLGISLAASLFKITVDSNFFIGIMNNSAVFEGWKFVRDFLNIFFIFFLLISAFATVFQVSSFHIKKTWIMIVVMALLVNFSWPITRVVIDFSNVIMIEMIGDENSDNTLLATFGKESKFTDLMIGTSFGKSLWGGLKDIKFKSLSTIIIGAISSMIVFFTFLAIALVLLTRIIILAAVLIFAPIGFVFLAFPSTKSIAMSWWDKLFKQAFIGPIMIFMLLLATKILESSNKKVTGIFESILSTDTTLGDAFSDLSMYIIGIGFFWMAIIVSHKMGGVGSGMAISMGKKMGNRAVGFARKATVKTVDTGMGMMTNRMVNSDNRAANTVGNALSFTRSLPKRAKNIMDSGDKTHSDVVGQSVAHGLSTTGERFGGDSNATANNSRKRVNKILDKQKDKSTDSIMNGLDNTNTEEFIASLQTLKERDDISSAQMQQLTTALNRVNSPEFNGDSRQRSMRKNIVDKATSTGNALMLVQHGGMNEREMIDSIKIEDYGKQTLTQEFNRNPGDANLERMVRGMNDKINNLSTKNKEKINDSLSTTQRNQMRLARGRIYGRAGADIV